MKKQHLLEAAGMVAFFIFSAQMAGVLGAIFTVDAIPGWYATLNKPWFTPPGWLFGPVWTLLYTLMGVAAYLVWKQKGSADHGAIRVALLLYTVQLGLNAVWSLLFFGGQSAGLAFAEILLLWLAILLTTLHFWRINRTAGALFVPYLLWVTFATALNFAIWQLN